MDNDEKYVTRSVKYKEIQEKLDNENDEVKSKAEIKREKKKREEELYLTMSLKPLRKRLTLKKSVKRVLRVVLLTVILFSFCHFIALPLYHKYLDSKPKAIIDGSIDYVFDNIDAYLNMSNDGLYLNATNRVDGVNYGYAIGSDDKEFMDYLYVESNDDSYGIVNLKDDNNYLRFTNDSSKYVSVSLDEEPLNLRSIYSIFNYSKDDMKYLVKTKRDILKAIIKDDYIKTSRQDLDVSGKSIKVRKNSLQLNKKNSKSFYEDYIKEISNNNKYLSIVSKSMNMNEDEYKAYLEKELLSDIKDISFNIYTVNGDEFVGFDYEVNGFRQIYYYVVKDKINLYISLEEGKYAFNISGVKKKDLIEAKVKCNEVDLGSITIREMAFDKIDFDYNLNINGKENSGFLLYELNKDSNEAGVQIKNNVDGNSLVSNGSIKYNKKTLEYSVDDKKKISSEDYNKELSDLKSSIEKSNLNYSVYSNWSSFINNPLEYIFPVKKGN